MTVSVTEYKVGCVTTVPVLVAVALVDDDADAEVAAAATLCGMLIAVFFFSFSDDTPPTAPASFFDEAVAEAGVTYVVYTSG